MQTKEIKLFGAVIKRVVVHPSSSPGSPQPTQVTTTETTTNHNEDDLLQGKEGASPTNGNEVQQDQQPTQQLYIKDEPLGDLPIKHSKSANNANILEGEQGTRTVDKLETGSNEGRNKGKHAQQRTQKKWTRIEKGRGKGIQLWNEKGVRVEIMYIIGKRTQEIAGTKTKITREGTRIEIIRTETAKIETREKKKETQRKTKETQETRTETCGTEKGTEKEKGKTGREKETSTGTGGGRRKRRREKRRRKEKRSG
jgi:hypothetical protein